MSNTRRFKILERDGFKCAYCGKVASETELEVDHIIPRAKGGTDIIENLITACFECNRGKRDRLLKNSSSKNTLNEIEAMANDAHMQSEKLRVKIDAITYYFLKSCPSGHKLTNRQIGKLRTFTRVYDINLLLEAVDISTNKYIPDHASDWHYENAINKIGGILYNKTKDD